MDGLNSVYSLLSISLLNQEFPLIASMELDSKNWIIRKIEYNHHILFFYIRFISYIIFCLLFSPQQPHMNWAVMRDNEWAKDIQCLHA